MKELELTETQRAEDAFVACLAAILERPLADLPGRSTDGPPTTDWPLSRWLGGLGLGLVRVADAASFAWSGPWIARGRAPEVAGQRSLIMFGSTPSAVAWDPSGVAAMPGWTIEEGYVVAALDVALAQPELPAAPAENGVVESIWLAPSAGLPAVESASVEALPGVGLAGDRHAVGKGTFASGLPGSALTLIDREVCDSFSPPLQPDEHRRNVVTRGIDLNRLVGHEFAIGEVRCRGMRLCEPCAVVEGYGTRPILRALVHRGGLRADILSDGAIAVGDVVRVL